MDKQRLYVVSLFIIDAGCLLLILPIILWPLRRGFPEGLEMFDVLEDPRTGNATRHPFGSIIFISLCAIICGVDTCEGFVRFAKTRRQWLEGWIALPDGISCPNTFLRIFSAIAPTVFGEYLLQFVMHLSPDL